MQPATEKSQSVAAAFEVLFPEVKVNVTVDLSKYWDSKTDRAYIQTGKDAVDAIFLQTVHDYPRWKDEGRLMPYKVKDWDQIDGSLKDSEGYYLGTFFREFPPPSPSF
jgi:ABC-type Fe3+ transport system substrate-binding protein